jgi:hypothetical protein
MLLCGTWNIETALLELRLGRRFVPAVSDGKRVRTGVLSGRNPVSWKLLGLILFAMGCLALLRRVFLRRYQR